MRTPQDSTGRPIGVGDRVSWRGQIYTIKSFGDHRNATRAILFDEPLHVADEIPDEIAVDLVEAAPRKCPWCGGDCGVAGIYHPALGQGHMPAQSAAAATPGGPVTAKSCTNGTPSWFTGHWRDWHRGHGCDRDDGEPRSEDSKTEIAQHEANAATGFLTDAELRMLRASTTSGNELLVRALNELTARRAATKLPVPSFDHSNLSAKHFQPLLGYCVCKHCERLPMVAPATEDQAP